MLGPPVSPAAARPVGNSRGHDGRAKRVRRLVYVWAPPFKRAFKRTVRRAPGLRADTTASSENPFHPALRTLKLIGRLKGIWACSLDEDY